MKSKKRTSNSLTFEDKVRVGIVKINKSKAIEDYYKKHNLSRLRNKD